MSDLIQLPGTPPKTNITQLPRRAQVPGDLLTLSLQWIGSLRARGYAENTCSAYGRDLEFLREYLVSFDITLVQLIGRHEVEHWLEERSVHFENSPRSVARKFSTVKNFLNWCRGHGFVTHDACRDVVIRYRVEPVIAPELKVLLRLIESIPLATPIGIRDRALFRLMLDSAARVGQVCLLNLPDPVNPPRDVLDVDRLQARFRKKGGGLHVAGFDTITRHALNRYLKIRRRLKPAPGEQAVFLSRLGRRITRQAVHYRLKHYAKGQNIPGMHCHKFRHRRAGEVIRSLGLEAGQKLLGHSSKATTAAIYGAEADEVVRAQIRQNCALGGRA